MSWTKTRSQIANTKRYHPDADTTELVASSKLNALRTTSPARLTRLPNSAPLNALGWSRYSAAGLPHESRKPPGGGQRGLDANQV